MSTSRCRSCHKAIVWAKTVTGKSMPLDVEPVEGGNIQLVDGIAHVVGKGAQGELLYLSHFATCSSAARHRKPKTPGDAA
jgi:hypothetical protein